MFDWGAKDIWYAVWNLFQDDITMPAPFWGLIDHHSLDVLDLKIGSLGTTESRHRLPTMFSIFQPLLCARQENLQ
jgi:hypothetical protein